MKRIISLLTLVLAFIISSEAESVIPLKSVASYQLEGGIDVERYICNGGPEIGKRRFSVFSYDIMWPVSGPTEVVNAIREKIVETLKGDLIIKLPKPTATNFPEIANAIAEAEINKDKRDQTNWYRKCVLVLRSNGSAISLWGHSGKREGVDVNSYMHLPPSSINMLFSGYRISDGKEFTKDLLPSWEKIRPLVCANFNNNNGRQIYYFGGQNYGYNKDNLPAPKNLPIFDKDHMQFLYLPDEIGSQADGNFFGSVDYSDIYEYASDELKTFLPKEAGIKEGVLFTLEMLYSKYDFKENGEISTPGYHDIGSWERCPYDPNVLIIMLGDGNGDGVSGCVLKDNRIYFLAAGSEPFEIKYFPNTDIMAAIWWNDEIYSGHPSELESYPVSGDLSKITDAKNLHFPVSTPATSPR